LQIADFTGISLVLFVGTRYYSPPNRNLTLPLSIPAPEVQQPFTGTGQEHIRTVVPCTSWLGGAPPPQFLFFTRDKAI